MKYDIYVFKLDSHNQLRSPMTERELYIVSIIITLFRIISIINMNIFNDPCEYRNIHFIFYCNNLAGGLLVPGVAPVSSQ
jgi:hypothetical protein